MIPGFDMPVKVRLSGTGFTTLRPTTRWQTAPFGLANRADFRVDENFYVIPKDLDAPPRP